MVKEQILSNQSILFTRRNGEFKIFKRDKLADEKDIWTLDTSLNVSQIMQTNKDFCEQQLKT